MGIVLYIALVGNVFIIPIIYVGLIWIQVFLHQLLSPIIPLGIGSITSFSCIIFYPFSGLSKASRIPYNQLFY